MANERLSLWQRLKNTIFTRNEPWYLIDQPAEVKTFINGFKAYSDRERELFKHMMTGVRRFGISLDEQHHIMAQFSDANMLRYLYEKHPYNDNEVRTNIARNPWCPEDLAKSCLHDRDAQVRRAAIGNERVSAEDCLDFVQYETDPHVQAALKERLGPQYPFSEDGAAIFPVETFIGRCFERNMEPGNEKIDMGPILAAYRERERVLGSEDAEQHMDEAVIKVADAPLLDILCEKYRTDQDMLHKIVKNQNCPEEVREMANMYLDGLQHAANDKRTAQKEQQNGKNLDDAVKDMENNPHKTPQKTTEKTHARLDDLIQNATARVSQQPAREYNRPKELQR